MDILEIDGSVLEGGGQILRNALSLSCILRRPIKVIKIRAGRSKPGLAAQHLFGLNLLQEITNGKVSGNSIGSTTIEFHPGDIKSGKYCADTKTAGSVSLLLQVALPVLLYGKNSSELDLKGGTNAAMAPQVDFITEILRPNLEQFGVTFDFDLFKRGYYPKGGGHCHFKIPSVKKLNSVKNTEFGSVSDIFGWSYVAGVLPIKVAAEMKNGAIETLRNICALDKINIEAYKESPEMSRESSSGIILGANTTNSCVVGSSCLGDRKVKPWNSGSNAAKELLNCLENKQCTDKYVQDQLILYMALADGESVIQSGKPTMHTLTAIHVAELMAGVKFETVEQQQGGTYLIKCKGIGFTNKSY